MNPAETHSPTRQLIRSQFVKFALVLATSALLFVSGPEAASSEILLTVQKVRTNGLVVGKVDLTEAARLCGKLPWLATTLTGVDTATGRNTPLQFIPGSDFNPSNHVVGTIIGRLSTPGGSELRLNFIAALDAATKPSASWDGKVTGPGYTVEHDSKQQGGLPWRITFSNDKVLDSFRWNNRLHHRTDGSFCVCDDSQPSVERVSAGPLCTVVRVKGRFVQGGRQPASGATAVYDWYYFADQPLVYVTAQIQQGTAFTWHEAHPLELNYPGKLMPNWAGGDPAAEGRFEATHKSLPQSVWGLVHDGTNGVGMFQAGQVLLYDGDEGTYIQAHGDSAWQEWSELQREFSACIWIGTDTQPAAAMQQTVRTSEFATHWSVTVDTIRARLDSARRQLAAKSAEERRHAWWRIEGATQLAARGRFEAAIEVADGQMPGNWSILESGDLGLILERTTNGIAVQHLYDSLNDQSLAAAKPLPLFSLVLRETGKETQTKLTAEAGWREVSIEEESGSELHATNKTLRLQWTKPVDTRLGDLRVLARVTCEPKTSSLVWTLSVRDVPSPWSVSRVVFPQVAVADLGTKGTVFFPKAAGQLETGPWQRSVRFSGTYPSGWTSMQFMAAYDATRPTGLYLASHDPWGSTKDLLVESRPAERAVVLAFDHPAPDMGKPGTGFELSGTGVWKLLHGDWFDAAVTYRDWVRKEAKWYPKMEQGRRLDTPEWMRALSVWALSGGPSSNCVPEVQEFTDFLSPPAGVHWYNWHEIPFDNDYPHYFPTKPEFADGVRELQSKGTYVMPYINGRLWDSRDQRTNDFEFTKVALAAVTKNEKGEPYLESYGSKEADGGPVRLGVMCPTTELWQKKIREIVLRLMNECGVKGVYIDQIAAAAPTLCSDASHGHPLGGGHWWTEGYWKMLDSIRREMPKDRMLTTECNGEPFIRYFDGYLTWHWQYDGQVPAFPAVYGGAIQMFGRSYGGGSTRDLALRMRVGQQLVYGEQIGWISPGVVKEQENADFLRKAVQLRRKLVRYFNAGEMARPPKLTGTIPKVRADWQWGGESWVTTDALLAGAWHLPLENRMVLVFANVSTEPVNAEVEFDAQPYGLEAPTLKVDTHLPEGSGDSFTPPAKLQRREVFPARTVFAWEMSAP